MIRSFVTAAALSLAVIGSSAFAAPALQVDADDQARQELVSSSGVDFNDPQQVAAFYSKLRAAAARVCAQESLSCRSRALADAVRQTDRQELTSLYTGRDNGAAQMAETRSTYTVRR